jgi:hypothetical protein
MHQESKLDGFEYYRFNPDDTAPAQLKLDGHKAHQFAEIERLAGAYCDKIQVQMELDAGAAVGDCFCSKIFVLLTMFHFKATAPTPGLSKILFRSRTRRKTGPLGTRMTE